VDAKVKTLADQQAAEIEQLEEPDSRQPGGRRPAKAQSSRLSKVRKPLRPAGAGKLAEDKINSIRRT